MWYLKPSFRSITLPFFFVPHSGHPWAPRPGFILIRVRVVGDVPHEALEQWRTTAAFRDQAKQARRGRWGGPGGVHGGG